MYLHLLFSFLTGQSIWVGFSFSCIYYINMYWLPACRRAALPWFPGALHVSVEATLAGAPTTAESEPDALWSSWNTRVHAACKYVLRCRLPSPFYLPWEAIMESFLITSWVLGQSASPSSEPRGRTRNQLTIVYNNLTSNRISHNSHCSPWDLLAWGLSFQVCGTRVTGSWPL